MDDDLSQQSDAYLVGMIVNGDAEAVRPLIERYRKPLLAMPVHPADREYLWRFQGKKMLARLRGLGAR